MADEPFGNKKGVYLRTSFEPCKTFSFHSPCCANAPNCTIQSTAMRKYAANGPNAQQSMSGGEEAAGFSRRVPSRVWRICPPPRPPLSCAMAGGFLMCGALVGEVRSSCAECATGAEERGERSAAPSRVIDTSQGLERETTDPALMFLR